MTYPPDIMAAAIRALMAPEYDYAETVAAAIHAERQRCANVARFHPDSVIGKIISDAIMEPT